VGLGTTSKEQQSKDMAMMNIKAEYMFHAPLEALHFETKEWISHIVTEHMLRLKEGVMMVKGSVFSFLEQKDFGERHGYET